MQIGSGVAGELEPRGHVEDDLLVHVAGEHAVFDRADSDHIGGGGELVLGPFADEVIEVHAADVRGHLLAQAAKQHHVALARRHRPVGQLDHLVGHVLAALGLGEAHLLEGEEDVAEVVALAHVDDVDRSVDAILLELEAGEGEVLGGVEAGAVALAQHEEGHVLDLVVDDADRALADDEHALRQELVDQREAGLVDLALVEHSVEANAAPGVDLGEVVERPLPRL
ncbi:MAG: hypothetical protein IPJ59_28585 [Nannocystis sp.]|nr:hypothetical protein [Nannocystis sp.]MBK7829121.1 hypothetical protein [Nannocystis sp.]